MVSARSQRPLERAESKSYAFVGCEGGDDAGGGLDGAADGDVSGAVVRVGPVPQ